MWEFDNFHEEHGRIPTQEEWEALCPDYWVWVGWYSMGDSLAGIYADNEEDAIRLYITEYL